MALKRFTHYWSFVGESTSHPWIPPQSVSNAELPGFRRCRDAQEQLNTALRCQVWVTPFGYGQVVAQLYFRHSLLCCGWQWLASSKEQPNIYFVVIRLSFFTWWNWKLLAFEVSSVVPLMFPGDNWCKHTVITQWSLKHALQLKGTVSCMGLLTDHGNSLYEKQSSCRWFETR